MDISNRSLKPSVTPVAAYAAIISAAIFVVLLAILHIIKPEFDPTWRLISEYEIGQNGWLMRVAFFCLAFGTISLFVALYSEVRTVGGKIGLALLLIAAAGMSLGGAFVSDPITTPPDDFTVTGIWHNIGGSMMIFPAPFFTFLISWSLVRHNPAWKSATRWLMWPVALIALGLVTFIFISAVQYDNASTPDVKVGLPNRFFIVSYCAWIMITAWQVIKIKRRL